MLALHREIKVLEIVGERHLGGILIHSIALGVFEHESLPALPARGPGGHRLKGRRSGLPAVSHRLGRNAPPVRHPEFHGGGIAIGRRRRAGSSIGVYPANGFVKVPKLPFGRLDAELSFHFVGVDRAKGWLASQRCPHSRGTTGEWLPEKRSWPSAKILLVGRHVARTSFLKPTTLGCLPGSGV